MRESFAPTKISAHKSSDCIVHSGFTQKAVPRHEPDSAGKSIDMLH